MSEQTVLFVDDEEPIVRALQRALRKEPYRILTATSGALGLDILEKETVQLVVSDQRMPGMTGSEFLKIVSERYPEAVRVILSGYAEAHVIVDAINGGGVYRFMSKPWDDAELKAQIRQCLEHHDLRQDNRRLSALTQRQIQDLENLNLRLEAAMANRTRSLAFAQEVLEALPRAVLGISCEQELVLSNAAARNMLPAVAASVPGTEIADLFPADVVTAIGNCLSSCSATSAPGNVSGANLVFRAAPLHAEGETRGCVVLIEVSAP